MLLAIFALNYTPHHSHTMKTLLLTLALLTLLPLGGHAQNNDNLAPTEHNAATEKYQAGAVIPRHKVTELGVERFFYAVPIDSCVLSRIYGKSYKEDCTMPLEQLRYLRLLHCDMDGETMVGELICNEVIAQDLLSIFKTLYEARYPIEKMVLVDNYNASDDASMIDNNSSAFNFRYISGTNKLSNHSWGLAVDINPLYNPYVRTRNGRTLVDPKQGAQYTDRNIEHPYMIKEDDLCHREFLRHGFEWGGSWTSSKDYQHFEKKID